jgi:hypothetical protein
MVHVGGVQGDDLLLQVRAGIPRAARWGAGLDDAQYVGGSCGGDLPSAAPTATRLSRSRSSATRWPGGQPGTAGTSARSRLRSGQCSTAYGCAAGVAAGLCEAGRVQAGPGAVPFQFLGAVHDGYDQVSAARSAELADSGHDGGGALLVDELDAGGQVGVGAVGAYELPHRFPGPERSEFVCSVCPQSWSSAAARASWRSSWPPPANATRCPAASADRAWVGASALVRHTIASGAPTVTYSGPAHASRQPGTIRTSGVPATRPPSAPVARPHRPGRGSQPDPVPPGREIPGDPVGAVGASMPRRDQADRRDNGHYQNEQRYRKAVQPSVSGQDARPVIAARA